MLPDMSDALIEWEQATMVKAVTKITVDFEPVDIVTGREVMAVVQNAQRDQLTTNQIESGQRYLMVHSRSELDRGEFIEYNGADYKFINDADYADYGYYETLAEATNRPVLVVS